MRLDLLGWNEALESDFAVHRTRGHFPARVAVEHRNEFQLYWERGEMTAALGGRARHSAATRLDLPAVGDWVAVSASTSGGLGLIEAVLPRRSLFTRKVAGRGHGEQIVAANIDVVFIVTSLAAEFNARMLERYLTLGFESGARPVVVLSKADVCPDRDAFTREVTRTAGDVPVVVTSAVSGAGVRDVLKHLRGHRTGALLGSSGVGKSTLINALIGDERMETGSLRSGGTKGRHTTSHRELVPLPDGGLLMDTPGMRELQLSEAGHGLLAAFEDVIALAGECSFRDCKHGPEPDCAVKEAVESGRITQQRVQGYRKLMGEVARLEEAKKRRASIGTPRQTVAARKARRGAQPRRKR